MTKQIQLFNNIAPKAFEDIEDDYFLSNEPIDNPDAIILRSAKLHDMTFAPETKYIGRAGAGTNNIPVERATEAGIVVCNAPGANANGVKELAAMSLVMASRNVLDALKWTDSLKGQDDIAAKIEAGKKNFVGRELRHKKMGVIGLGSIGGRVANMCIDFGMTVYGYDPYVTLRSAWGVDSRVKYTEDLQTIFSECDLVSLHVPYTEENHHMINSDILAYAKDRLILINLARDGLVDLDALEAAIESGRVGTYVVDFPEEKTLNMRNTINIPHLGASTPESQENAARMVINQMTDYLENGNITNSVNYPDVNLGVCRSTARIALNHRNIPNMLAQIIDFLREKNINIATLANDHRGEWAYTLIDIESDITEETLEKMINIDGVVRARIIRPN